MDDRISDQRLREIVADEDDYAEARSMAAELLAARQKIRADAEHLPTIESLTRDLHETEQELNAARARVAVLERGLVQLVLEDEDAAFDRLDDRLTRCGIMPTQATLDAAKETNP